MSVHIVSLNDLSMHKFVGALGVLMVMLEVRL